MLTVKFCYKLNNVEKNTHPRYYHFTEFGTVSLSEHDCQYRDR